MKLTIDDKNKTIEINTDEKVNLGELMKKLEKFLPNEEWKEYSFLNKKEINIQPTPIYPTYPNPWDWYWNKPFYVRYNDSNTTDNEILINYKDNLGNEGSYYVDKPNHTINNNSDINHLQVN